MLLQFHGEVVDTDVLLRIKQPGRKCPASMRACKKFDKYLYGLDQFRLETDNGLLVPFFNSLSLDNAPLKCQCLLMWHTSSKPDAVYVPGRNLVIASALSQSHQTLTKEETGTHSEVECCLATVLTGIQASQSQMENKVAAAADRELLTVIKYIRSG